MPSISYGAGSYVRTNGSFPPLELINMFVEQSNTSEGGVALLSRPGLGLLATAGSGPINGMYSKRGTLSGDVFSISNTTLYRGTTSLGTVAGSGVPSFAGGENELLVCRGSTMRSYNGTNIANVVFPDSASVTAVDYIGSLFVAIRASTQKFYWSSPLDGRTWAALDFASAEREPDLLLDIKALGDNIWLFGQSTVETWQHTGDAALPFTRLEQVAFDKGIHSTGAVVKADNTLVFVGSNSSVYRIGDVPERISTHAIEERILDSTNVKMFTFQLEGHEFVCVRLDTETLAYDMATGEWCEFQSSGGQWIVAAAAMVGKVAYLGHQTTGQLMGWDEWDDMGASLERRFTAAQPLDTITPVYSVALWTNPGQTPLTSPTSGYDPLLYMRYSRDAGQTWSAYDSCKLGQQTQYRVRPEFRALGSFDFPGLMMEFKVTDPVPFRVSAVKVNDPAASRARV